jgi:hypothetical protein
MRLGYYHDYADEEEEYNIETQIVKPTPRR